MDKKRIAELISVAGSEEAAKLSTLYNAMVSGLEKYKTDSSVAKLKDWQAAEEALQSVVQDLENKYNPEPSLKNRLEVMKHLRREGFKIGKTKLYKDASDGLLRIQPDGSVLEKDIDRYVRISGLKKPAEISDAELQQLQKKKNEMEVEKLTAQVSDLTFKQDVARGKFIPRAEFEMEVAGRAGALDAGLRHRFMSECRDMVDAVSGEASLVPILQEMLGKMLDEALNEYASLDNFQVIIER